MMIDNQFRLLVMGCVYLKNGNIPSAYKYWPVIAYLTNPFQTYLVHLSPLSERQVVRET